MARTKAAESPQPATPTSTVGTQAIDLTPEEIQAIIAAREKVAQSSPTLEDAKVNINDLTKALVEAINLTREKPKVRAYQRKKICKKCGIDHRQNIKLKRSWLQHGGIELNPLNYCNETLELLNKVKPGFYVNGLVRVTKRKDRSYDITWPVRTVAQRLKVLESAQANSFEDILRRCIAEYEDPKKFRGPADNDEDDD